LGISVPEDGRVRRRSAALFIILITVSALAIISVQYPRVHAQSTTNIGVWNNACASSNITISNAACGTLSVSDTFTVDINLTDAPQFNAFELALFYDPTSIALASFDVSSGTMFSNPFIAKSYTTPLGVFRLSVANLGGGQLFSGSGTLAHITFQINGLGASPLVLAAAMADPSPRATGSDGNGLDWTRLISSASGSTIPVETLMTTSDGYFRNVVGPGMLPPIASFTWSPSTPFELQSASFDGSASRDPDNTQTGNGISKYNWAFGDGTLGFTGPLLDHFLQYPGNFSVVLTVTDSDNNFQAMKALVLTVSQTPQHNIAINALLLNGSPIASLNPGDKLNLVVTVVNPGTFPETFNLSISYKPPLTLIPPLFINEVVQPGASHTRRFNATLATTSLGFGNYEVDAQLTDPNVHPSVITTKALFTIVEPVSIPYLPIALGIVLVIAVPSSVLLLRRRRREDFE